MILSKWITALGIFLTMFLGAWWTNVKHERVFQTEDTVQIQQVDVTVHEPFKHREYIKIR